ncbi:hypothetical protein [Actinoallomurus sp. NPDC052274]|uniref:hypothetical protein n=1 Tax=Actinoallomurus sp. NPDC052274 TaxID=3155420 RepID=UPI00342C8AD7
MLTFAYCVPFIGRYAEVLAAGPRPPAAGMPESAVLAAAITFLHPPPGEVQAITGVREAAEAPGVQDVAVHVAPGATVGPVRTSGDLVGHVIAVGRDAEEARRRADRAAGLIRMRPGE